MSLRMIPPASNPTSTQSSLGAPSAPGVHDTLRSNLALSAPAPKATAPSTTTTTTTTNTTSTHPLEARLTQWRAQQDALKSSLLRRQFGIAEPVRRGMELGIVKAGEWRPEQLGGTAGLHRDVLEGRDETVDWEDVYPGGFAAGLGREGDFHSEMERGLGMQW